MHRDHLLELLGRYVPIDARDDAQRRAIESFVRQYEQCFERSLAHGHLTGSAWLLDSRGERALLTHHRKLDLWIQVGGHADGDPDLLSVALREAREESGIARIRPVSEEIFDLDIHPIPEVPGEPGHLHFDIRFLLQACGNDTFVVSEESHALGWFTLDELAAMELDDAVRRMRVKWERLRQGEP